ncbi:hypothetical protein SLUN_00690 [Streptomyces lunaelactis]|uniref:Integral membrane protein n=1 Tax=Streptomyces lunaelactis TaxID=1535768 RepID=A0A2R4SVV6_9ACTN|nr:hypothetical protein [Streptomyces lunaelactis]AVZ70996.1 hypothetical protein SLUN_00690 [Streptomyces lunaelactis]NUK27472.1 hypothetical protein [Streptomyces lunaelactis]NUK54323.1 hypothetical protein [Streptomyces lunaelactis]NUK68069.1 hypothetical protein [Streptomyces lunaelactis]NUK88828.1 hypothetical protein [Streptomyces lunaelactis]
MTVGRGVRAVRAAVFAAVCVLLAVIGHVLMSESGVPWWTVGAGAVITGAAAWCLSGRERTLLPVVVFAVAAQTALHTAFSLAQTAQTAASPMPPMHHHHPMQSMASTAHDMTGGGMTSSTGMLAAHLLAALLSGLWLAYGERAAFRILRALADRLVAPLCLLVRVPALPHRPPRIRVRRNRRARTPRQLLLAHAFTTRGPPTGTAVS